MKQERETYNPNGLGRKSPQVGLRLKPDEMAAVERMAELEQRSLSSMCRLVLLKGLDAIHREKSRSTPPQGA